jgi:hypothetical protein
VIISLSYFSLTKAREEAMRSSESVQYFCDSYFMLYDDKLKKVTYTPETSYFISWLKYTMGVPFEVSKELGHYLRIISGNMHYQYYPFWGGFQIVPALDKGVQLEERIAAHFDLSGAEIELSNILIDYFDRINKYCNERGIRLITVNTPKIEGYDKMVPEGYKTALEKVVNEMEFKYKNYLYLDYSRAEMELKYMRDADHLNYEGAKLFSHELYNDIESILIEGADYDN